MANPKTCRECPYHIVLPLRKKKKQIKLTYYCLCRYDYHFVPIELYKEKRYMCQLLDGDINLQYKDDSERNIVKEEIKNSE